MLYFPELAIEALYSQVIRPLPCISKVVTYVERVEGADALVIHIFSDNGEYDTVIPKMLTKAMPNIVYAFELEKFSEPDDWAFATSYTSDMQNTVIPIFAQLLYVRVD